MFSEKLMLTSVHWNENVKALRDFRNLLNSSMGPEGCVKVIVTGGGILQLTSTSNSLISRLDLEQPICRFIGHVAQGLPDYGLYYGVMVSDLVQQLWIEKSISKQKFHSSVHTLLEFIQLSLTSDIVCRKVDFSSISTFMPLVRTVMLSKCPTYIFHIDINSLCIEIVKAFLNCLDERTNELGRVIVKVESGPNSVSSYRGLLYQITEDHTLKLIEDFKGQVKLLIFTIKLDNSDTRDETPVVAQVMPILKQAIESNVRLVACQKTVAPEIKLFLRRHKVILLERMGTSLTEHLVSMTHAFPLSQIGMVNFSDIEKLIGTLTSVEHIQYNDSDYILMNNTDASISTLLIQNYCLAGTEHLEALTQQAINSLRFLALHPTLTFGGGCLEIWLIAQIHILKESHNDKEFLKLLCWVQQSLLSACGSHPADSVDSVFHHGWANEADRCKCGLVTEGELNKEQGLLISMEELVNTQCSMRVKLNAARQSTAAVSPDILVDCHKQKLNVIISVIETFANIADIGFIMYNGSDT